VEVAVTEALFEEVGARLAREPGLPQSLPPESMIRQSGHRFAEKDHAVQRGSTRSSMMRVTIGAAFLLLLTPGTALAQQDPKSACRGDYFRFCSAHRPGTPDVEKCFRDNIQKVSESCRGAIRASRGEGAKAN
jgi:hypothetical protein